LGQKSRPKKEKLLKKPWMGGVSEENQVGVGHWLKKNSKGAGEWWG